MSPLEQSDEGEWVDCIVLGLPGRFNQDTDEIRGPASYVLPLSFNGAIFIYYGMSYWQALWAWLKGEE